MVVARTALVTGGARGIGRAIVEHLASRGWNVVFTYRSSAGTAQQVAGVETAGGVVVARECDVRDTAAMKVVVEETVAQFGGLDGLVNNAGVRRDALAYNMSPDEWSEVLDTNLHGSFSLTQLVLPHMMRARAGAIVNVASLTALHGVVGQANYAAAKGGLVAMTRVLARELARSGIRVNCVAPGLVETDMIADLPKEARQELLKGIPMRRVLRPGEVAAAVEFFLSDAASGITGQTLAIDGGASA